MNDWGMSVLSQYPVTVRATRKVRGALLCDTKEGLYLLSEYRGKQARLEAEAALLLYLAENGMVHTDQIIKNEKEELLSKNEEGTGYVLKMWYPWPECSVSSIGDLVQAVNSLARLHVSMRRMPKHLLIKQEKVQSEESKQDMTEGNAVTIVSFAVCVPICIVKRKNQCLSSSSKKALMKCIIRQTLQCVQ